MRLSIPVHPVVYVSPGVNDAQAERERTDTMNYSNPLAVQHGRMQSRSIGAGLGFDPALFVQQAVRDAQARGEWWSNIVEGRLARLSLGSDGRIPTPEWFEPSNAQIVPTVPGRPAGNRCKPENRHCIASGRQQQTQRLPVCLRQPLPHRAPTAPSFS